MKPRYMPIPQAVSYSGETRTRIYQRIADGEIVAVKSGRRTLVDVASYDRVLDALPRADIQMPSTRAALAA